MTGRHTLPLRIAAVTASVAAACAMTALSATADESAAGGVEVINTETVQIYTDATGSVDTRRIYEQLAFTGNGSVDLSNPIETDGLRNLDGFGGFDVEEGNQVATVTVDGQRRLRSVSDYAGDLPLDVKVRYYLDGELVEPGDVVGESGELEVKYTVKNVTGVEQEVTLDDGQGGTVTRTVEVPIPMVGSLTTVAPPNFTDVASGEAVMAGDGKGGTKLSFTMTLFPPIGSDTVEFGYTATITDGVVPRASISTVPVNPLENTSYKNAGEAYKGGADTGIELTNGAIQIDENLLKLRDGAGELLAGLIKLRDGADKLNAGLAGVAAPGAARLANGAGELAGGMGKIDDGAGKLADGSGQLSDGADQVADGAGELADGSGRLVDGTGRLDDGAGKLAGGSRRLAAGAEAAYAGSKQLSEGLGLISGGLGQLADAQKGLPAAQNGVAQLQAGVDLIISKLGTAEDPATFIGGLAKLEAGLGELQTGAGQLSGGLNLLVGNVPSQSPGLKGAKGGVDQVKAGLDASLATGGSLDQLDGGLKLLEDWFCANYAGLGGPNAPDALGGYSCKGLVDQLQAGSADSRTKLTQASGGLGQVSAGLSTAIGALETQLIPGADKLSAGLGQAGAGATTLKEGSVQLKGGLQQVSGGLTQLSDGIAAAVTGVLKLSGGAQDAFAGSQDLSIGLGQLDAGAGELKNGAGRLAAGTGELDAGAHKLADGSGRLADGAGQLADGAGRLEDGADQLADGTGKAADGAGQVAEGAGKLATGLGEAAEGSGKIADGLGKAADGAPKLQDGAQRLSDEGTSKLVEAGEATAQDYGELYAVVEAGAERADAEKMVYGAPEGAFGLAAYSYEIKGEDGEGSRNVARGLGGIAVLAAGAGAFALRRRFI